MRRIGHIRYSEHIFILKSWYGARCTDTDKISLTAFHAQLRCIIHRLVALSPGVPVETRNRDYRIVLCHVVKKLSGNMDSDSGPAGTWPSENIGAGSTIMLDSCSNPERFTGPNVDRLDNRFGLNCPVRMISTDDAQHQPAARSPALPAGFASAWDLISRLAP